MYHEMICNMLSTIFLTSTAGAQENEVIAAIAIVFVLIYGFGFGSFSLPVWPEKEDVAKLGGF